MASKRLQIVIDSILGGHSSSQLFDGPNQYQDSFAIDPDMAFDQTYSNGATSATYATVRNKPLGAITPVKVGNVSGTTTGSTNWILQVPRPQTASSPEKYVYDSAGSVYTFGGSLTLTGLTDLNDGATASGNGAEYSDNYIYFARDTTIARYGPMNGTATFTDDYWVATLGKAALTNTTYPLGQYAPSATPNHILKRHTDGKMYIGDVVGNQGTLHYIATTKTTVEGDTDNGSTFAKLTFPYGYWPTAIESYGSDLAIALYDGNDRGSGYFNGQRAKIAFWDTTSQNYNQLIDFQFPDPYIAKILNKNGTLYLFSGNACQDLGLRISRYVGGIAFEEVAFLPYTYLPSPGAYDFDLERIYFGANYTPVDPTSTESSFGRPAIHAIGSKIVGGDGIYSVMGANASLASNITSFNIGRGNAYIGWSNSTQGGVSYRGNSNGDNMHGEKNVWRSGYYRIGGRFKIHKVRLPFVQPITALSAASTTKQVTPSIWVDTQSFAYTLATINPAYVAANTSANRSVVLRPDNAVGENGFFLHLEFDTDEPLSVGLPIVIEYELLDD